MPAPHADDFLEHYLARHVSSNQNAGSLPAWLPLLTALLALGGGLVSVTLGLDRVALGFLAGASALVGGASIARLPIPACLLFISLGYLLWRSLDSGLAAFSWETLMGIMSVLVGYLGGHIVSLRRALGRETSRNRMLVELNDIFLQFEDGCLKEIDLQGRLKSMNGAGQVLMEVCDFEHIRNRNWLDFWQEESRGAVQKAFDAARQGRPGRFTGYCPTFASTPKWWDVLVIPVLGDTREVESLLVVSWDISNLKHSAQDLQAANHTFQDLLESLNDGFFCIDKERRFVQMNSKAEQLLRYPRDALLGMNFREAFPDALAGDFAAASCDVLESGIPRHFEAYFEPLQMWCRVDAYPKPDGVYVFFNDITAQVQALQRSEATETRLRLTQEIARFADWQFDLASHELILSEQAAELLAIDNATPEPEPSAWLRQLHPDDRLALVGALLDLNEGKTSLSVQARVRASEGSGIWRDFHFIGERVTSQPYPQGRLVGCMQDVSVQKQTERRLIDAQAYARSVIDAVPQPFCVLDEAGDILSVNQAWINYFLTERTFQGHAGVGANYLELCGMGARRGDPSSQALIDKLQALLRGVGDPFTLEYDAKLSEGMKTFKISTTPCATGRRQVLVMHEDITVQRELHASLQASEARFREMVEYLPLVYWVYDLVEARFSYVSPALEKIWNMAPQSLYDDVEAWRYLIHPDDKALAIQFQENLLVHHKPADVEYRAFDASGRLYWIRNRAFPFYGAASKAERIIGIAEDITEAHTYRDRMILAEQFDAMTGLPNRGSFDSRLERQCIQAHQAGQEFVLLVFSLNRLKWVRQCLGQPAKQELMVQIATRLQSALDGRGYLARLASDEFAVLLSRKDDIAYYMGVVQALLNRFKRHFTLGPELLTLTACIGVARFPADGDDKDALMRSAATAAYAVQQAGVAGYQCFTPGLLQDHADALRLETELNRALEQQEFVLYYQPQLSLHTQRICGAEALIRWDHPVHGLVSPLRFVPLLEQSGLIVQVGLWCIHQALSQLAQWQAQGLQDFVIAVNLSLKQLQPGLVSQVDSALQSYGVAPQCLELELTESVMFEVGKSVEIIGELKALGVRIAVDDFGTGYSTLGSIKSFVPNTVKIDRGFLRDIDSNSADLTIVRSVIEMAHSLGMTTVAEGVETSEQKRLLEQLKCDQIQGYLLSPPIEANAFHGRFLASTEHNLQAS
jgi:diguanylate cyclase (GGDEF)-like protein/PAS domain S-box-containing protein